MLIMDLFASKGRHQYARLKRNTAFEPRNVLMYGVVFSITAPVLWIKENMDAHIYMFIFWKTL